MVYGGAAARRRATINDTPEGMRITVPAQRSWWPLVFLPFWLTLWTFGGFAAIGALIFGGGSWFLGLWLLGWAAGWVMAFSWWWWMLTGREIITIDGVRLKHAWKARGYERVRFRDLGATGNLRFSPPVYGMSNQNWRQLFQQMGVSGGSIAFDDERGEAHRFGVAVEEAEAKEIIAAIQSRYRLSDAS
jgi:hypothetical protein